MRFFSISLLALCCAGCVTTPVEKGNEQDNCPVIESKNWHGWIEPKRAGQESFTLNISGKVDLPTPAYEVSLVAGPMDRKMPPGQRFNLQIEPSSGISTQVITTFSVRYREPTTYPRYSPITIVCGGRELASITDVMVTE